jgi:hypothetical protein
MAGTVVITEERLGSIHKVKFAWTSSAGGAADATTTEYYTGSVIQAAQIPNGGGTQPTDQYDVTVVDADGVDVLNAKGANISNAATTQHVKEDELGCVANSKLTLAVTNAGNAKAGVTIVYLKVT